MGARLGGSLDRGLDDLGKVKSVRQRVKHGVDTNCAYKSRKPRDKDG